MNEIFMLLGGLIGVLLLLVFLYTAAKLITSGIIEAKKQARKRMEENDG